MFFFFSSRRRHTRSKRDWSSDVCSSDLDRDPATAKSFATRQNGTYFADLYDLARQRLAAAGVAETYGGEFCTATEERFFSFRRDQTTGRMASLIWLEED